jgi:transposase
MHISVACMRLDVGVMVNLALCKVNTPLTIVESINKRYAGYAEYAELRSASLPIGSKDRPSRPQLMLVKAKVELSLWFEKVLFLSKRVQYHTVVAENSLRNI